MPMTAISKHRFRFGIALLASSLAAFPVAGGAQTVNFVYGGSSYREGASERLSRHLRALAGSPRSLSALLGAGEAALELGDPQTALTFYARAEEVAPRDGKVKAGMGSALVLMEQPAAALRFFAEAASLGEREIDFADDRGLAYDLTGDPRRAQADYALVLKRGDNPEVRRRLALSLAISGDRAGALAAIDEQLRGQDRAAWRIRAFVLALSGDAAGATAAVEAVMPQQAAAMRPFFARLPTLNPAQRAMAVHFGHFPGDGQTAQIAQDEMQYAAVDSNIAPVGTTPAGRPDSGQAALGRRNPAPEPTSTEPRRRPGVAETPPIPSPVRARFGSRASNSRGIAAPAFEQSETKTKPPPVAQAASRPAAQINAAVPATVVAAQALPPSATAAQPGPTLMTQSAPARTELPSFNPATPERRSGLADLVGLIQALPEAATPDAAPEPEPAKPEPVKIALAEKKVPFGPPTAPPAAERKSKDAADKPATKAEADPAQTREPSRIWVQIASAPDSLAVSEFTRLKTKLPRLLSDKTAYKSPFRSTNRLLVGPFDSEGEAKAFVGTLAKADLRAVTWTSLEGQEIEKLSTK